MENPEQEIARTARRIRWTVRVAFLAAAALSAVLLLAQRAASDGDTTWLSARTDQGHMIGVLLRDGEPVFLETEIAATCKGFDEPWIVSWGRGPNAPVPWRYDDDHLVIDEPWRRRYSDGWVVTRDMKLDARVHDGRVTGQMSLVGAQYDPWGGHYPCESGAVTFSAG